MRYFLLFWLLLWQPGPVQDQHDTSRCVAFTWVAWLQSAPHAELSPIRALPLYDWAKAHDGVPDVPGTYIGTVGSRMFQLGYLQSLTYTESVADRVQWLQSAGPIIVGAGWTSNMEFPDSAGLAHPTGYFIGQHRVLCYGYDTLSQEMLCQNSWGTTWGTQGRFRILASDWQGVLATNGFACPKKTAGRFIQLRERN